MRALVISIFLYAFETWTLTDDLEKRIQAIEMRCFRKILGITYKDHVTNKEVRNRMTQATEPHEDLLATVKKRKLKWYSVVSRSSGFANQPCKAQCNETGKEIGKRKHGKTASENGQAWH